VAATSLLAAMHGKRWRRKVNSEGVAGAAMAARFLLQVNRFFSGG